MLQNTIKLMNRFSYFITTHFIFNKDYHSCHNPNFLYQMYLYSSLVYVANREPVCVTTISICSAAVFVFGANLCDSSLFGLCFAAICIWPLVLCFRLEINLFESVLQGATPNCCICESELFGCIWDLGL